MAEATKLDLSLNLATVRKQWKLPEAVAAAAEVSDGIERRCVAIDGELSALLESMFPESAVVYSGRLIKKAPDNEAYPPVVVIS